jgi:hypothetical protein
MNEHIIKAKLENRHKFNRPRHDEIMGLGFTQILFIS